MVPSFINPAASRSTVIWVGYFWAKASRATRASCATPLLTTLTYNPTDTELQTWQHNHWCKSMRPSTEVLRGVRRRLSDEMRLVYNTALWTVHGWRMLNETGSAACSRRLGLQRIELRSPSCVFVGETSMSWGTRPRLSPTKTQTSLNLAELISCLGRSPSHQLSPSRQ